MNIDHFINHLTIQDFLKIATRFLRGPDNKQSNFIIRYMIIFISSSWNMPGYAGLQALVAITNMRSKKRTFY
jgi:hypothetical protein